MERPQLGAWGFRARKSPSMARPRGARACRAFCTSGFDRLEGRALLAMVGVDVINSSFTPAAVTIHVGDSVEWAWDADDHGTTSVAGSLESWNSGVLNNGAMFDHTFTHIGTFTYYSMSQGVDNGDGTASGMSGTVTVLPASPLAMIMVMPVNFTVGAGAAQQYMAMGNFADNTTEDISGDVVWTSSNTAVATVSNAAGSQGMVTGVAAGTATITATEDGMTASADLTVTPPPPLVVLEGVRVVQKKHMVTQLVVDFSGAVSQAGADNLGTYRLATQGKRGSFEAKNSVVVKLKSAVLSAAGDEVTLSLKRPLALTKAVQLQVNGSLPGGLEDADGRVIDGNRDGQAGGNATAVIRRGGVSDSASALASSSRGSRAQEAAGAARSRTSLLLPTRCRRSCLHRRRPNQGRDRPRDRRGVTRRLA